MKKLFKSISIFVVISIIVSIIKVEAKAEMNYNFNPVFYDKENTQYEDVKILPEEIIELTTLDVNEVIELDSIDKDNMTTFTTINEDGTKTLYSFDKDVKYIDESTNVVKFIDASIKEVNSTDDELKNIAFISEGTPVEAVFPKNLEIGVELKSDNFSIRFIPKIENMDLVKMKFDNDRKSENNYGISEEYVEYSEENSCDKYFQYFATNNGIKENIIIEEYDGNNIIQFEIYLDGLTPLNNEGRKIEFIDSITQKVEYVINPSFIEEGYNINLDNKNVSYDNYYTIEKVEDNTYILNMILDKDFLENPNTVYPVLIDPTIGIAEKSLIQDTYTTSSSTENHSEESELYVANTSDLQSMAYIKYDVSDYVYLNPELINSVTFHAIESSNGSSIKASLYDCNNIYDIRNVNYNELKDGRGTLQSTCTTVTNYSFSITKLFKLWLLYELNEVGGKSWENGFILKTSPLKELTFISSECNTNYPYVTINYAEDTSINDGVYYIKNKSSGKYLEVPNSAMFSGIQCNQDEFIGSKNQQWKVTDVGDGTYVLRPMHNLDYALDVYSGTYNGSSVDIWESSESSPIQNVKWKIVKNSNDSYRMMSLSSEKQYCLAIKDGSAASGAGCVQTIYDANANKQWILEPAVDAAEYYVTNVDNDRNLSISSDTISITSAVNINDNKQRWSIVRQNNGYYKLYNKSGNWLDGEDYLGCVVNENTVKLNSGEANLWEIIINNDGTYSFKNVNNKKYLTIAISGSGVTAEEYTGQENQHWKIATAIKDISIGGMRDDKGCTNINWIDNSVRMACSTIGYKELNEFNCGDSEDVVEMIRDSSIFMILTHGNWDLLMCNSSADGTDFSYLITHETNTSADYTVISSLPDDVFATTRLCVIMACRTAYDHTKNSNIDSSLYVYDNLATTLHKKGVQTVIAFNHQVYSPAADVFLSTFINSLAEGETLGDAIDSANEDILVKYPEYEEQLSLILSPWLEIIGNDDLSATFSY